MLHFIYIIAFTVLAVLAITNMFRNLMTLGMESQRSYSPANASMYGRSQGGTSKRSVPHPELLDDFGNVVNEPLLIMRSITVEDAREQLDALYEASPGSSNGNREPREEV
ncbi:DUF2973 domain-containing protein [Phormidium sp. CLA17]|nr:DUF2973 domain-containing protein [Leptolyngbya sp. Cla-17]